MEENYVYFFFCFLIFFVFWKRLKEKQEKILWMFANNILGLNRSGVKKLCNRLVKYLKRSVWCYVIGEIIQNLPKCK